MDELDYGVIGNGRTAALVSREGSIEWLCFSDYDSPSVFSAMMNPARGGSFGFSVGEEYLTLQTYKDSSSILRTCFYSEEGTFEVLDFMPRYPKAAFDFHTPAEIYRYIRPLYGRPRFRVIYEPVMNYANDKAVHRLCSDCVHTFPENDPGGGFYLYTDLGCGQVIESEEILLTGERFMMISYHKKLAPPDINSVWLEYKRTLSCRTDISRSLKRAAPARKPEYAEQG